jgi:hypothetical protein
LRGLTRDGAQARTFAIPAPITPSGSTPAYYDSLSLRTDGGFIVAASSSFNGTTGLARLAPDGTLVWQYPNGNYFNVDFAVPVMLSPDDEILAADSGGVSALDVDGVPQWSAFSSSVAAIDASGRITTLRSDGDAVSLLTLDAVGRELRTTPLGSLPISVEACHIVLAYDGSTVVMLADEVPSPAITKAHVTLVALDASGATRWSTSLDATLPYDPAATSAHYGVFADASGTLVVTAGTVTGIDGASGSVLWTLSPPNPHSCLRPAVLGAGGSILATQCDGAVFLARDP